MAKKTGSTETTVAKLAPGRPELASSLEVDEQDHHRTLHDGRQHAEWASVKQTTLTAAPKGFSNSSAALVSHSACRRQAARAPRSR